MVEREEETTRARASLYRLLAFMVGREPDEAFLKEFDSGSFLDVATELGLRRPPVPAPEEAEAYCSELAAEYGRLFILPGSGLHPYESVQRGEGRLWGELTAEVQRLYREAGFELDPEAGQVPDHLAVELEFVAHLAAQEAEKWAAGSEEGAHALRERQRVFVNKHLGEWSIDFARSLRDETTHPYFVFLADMLETVVGSDGSFLGSPSGGPKEG